MGSALGEKRREPVLWICISVFLPVPEIFVLNHLVFQAHTVFCIKKYSWFHCHFLSDAPTICNVSAMFYDASVLLVSSM